MFVAVLFGIVFAILAYAASRRDTTPIAVFLFTLLAVYNGLPVLKFGFFGIPALVLVNGIIGLAIEAIYEEQGGDGRFVFHGIITGIGVVFLIAIPLITTLPIFHAASYRGIIGPVRESVFSTDTSPLDPSQIRIIDEGLARRLGEKRLGENTALGSQVNLGKLSVQKVRGGLYWVGPLEHSGFFKWWGSSGTPGYIMVSATNEQDVRLVQEIDRKPIAILYNGGAWYGDLPQRYLYNNGYMTTGLTDFTFEIDDSEEGRPYLVVTKYRKRVGYSGDDATGVVVLDVQTGEIHEYGIDDAPDWIDRIQPEAFVLEQLNDWGEYVHGWLNPSDLDRLQITPGTSLVYGDDGNSYFYTGITSVGADESTVGFVLVNTRTKEVRFYKQTGATETAAMQSAQGSMQEKEYEATFPILYNVGGIPTYFTTLKDKAGLVKAYAFVSVENYQIVGYGDNVQSALQMFRRSVASRGNDIAPDGPVSWLELVGRVLRVSTEIKGGNTLYYFLIEGNEEKVFVGSSDISPEMPLSQPGDRIQVQFDDGGNAIVDMTRFDNLALEFQATPYQHLVEARGDTVRRTVRMRQNEQNADAAWDELTPAQKAELIRSAAAQRE